VRTLNKLVSRHEVIFRVDVLEKARRCLLPRVIQRMAGYIVFLDQLLLEIVWQLILITLNVIVSNSLE